MPDFVFGMDPRHLAIYVTGFCAGVVVVGVLILKPVLRLLFGGGPALNDTISYATAGFTLFFGLLLGLLTVAAYQNNEKIRDGMDQEASALGVLYSSVNSYPDPLRTQIRAMLRDYTLYTIHSDLPAHRDGLVLNGGYNRIDAVRQRLAAFEPNTPRLQIIHASVLDQLQVFDEARQLRVSGTITQIPGLLWFSVLVGVAINLLLIVVLRIPLRQHLLFGIISGAFLGIIVTVMILLDRPFRGDWTLTAEPYQVLWDRVMAWDEAVS